MPETPEIPELTEEAVAIVEITQEQLDEIKTRIDAIQAERDEMKFLAQRVQADFDNFRKRNSTIRTESLDEGAREVVKPLLVVLDHFERALLSIKDNTQDKQLIDGMEMIFRQFKEELEKQGLEEIVAQAEQFDPELHNAIVQEKSDLPVGTITEVIQKGYKFKDKIIRYSMVKVAQ